MRRCTKNLIYYVINVIPGTRYLIQSIPLFPRYLLVNLTKVASIEPMFNGNYEIKMKNLGKTLPLSRHYVSAFKSIMGGSW